MINCESFQHFSFNKLKKQWCYFCMFIYHQIISGQNFPKPRGSGAKGDITDPYVTIEIFGIPADCAEEKTKTVNNNGKKESKNNLQDFLK